MLIAEDLLLLLTDDTTGKLHAPAPQVDLGLGGANLIELVLMNKVDLSHEGDEGKPGRVTVCDRAPTGDPILDAALDVLVTGDGKKPEAAVKALAKNLRQPLYERLTASGIVRSEHGRVLGLIPRHTWPTEDAEHETEVRRAITEALVERAPPDAHTAALIALLHALRCELKIVDTHQHGVSKDQVRSCAAEIATGSWASEAVRKTIDAMLAAIGAASTAATSTVVLPGAS